MRFSILISSSLAILASATPTPSDTPAQTEVQKCLGKCATGDVNCQAHCISVPSPNEAQITATTKCAAACPQGNGSPEATKNYADCQQKCIFDNFYQTSVGTPQATGAPAPGGNGGNSGSSPNQSGAPGSGNSGNGSSGAAQPTQSGATGGNGGSVTTGADGKPTPTSGGASGSAAPSKTGAAVSLSGSGAAFAGLLAAILAL